MWFKMKIQHSDICEMQLAHCWRGPLQFQMRTLEKRVKSQGNNLRSHLKNLEKQENKTKQKEKENKWSKQKGSREKSMQQVQ